MKKADFDRYMRQRQNPANSYDWLTALLVLILDDRELADKGKIKRFFKFDLFILCINKKCK